MEHLQILSGARTEKDKSIFPKDARNVLARKINKFLDEGYIEGNNKNISDYYQAENTEENGIKTLIHGYAKSRLQDANVKSVYQKSEATKEKRKAILDKLSGLEQYSTVQDAENYMNRLDSTVEKTISELQKRANLSVVR